MAERWLILCLVLLLLPATAFGALERGFRVQQGSALITGLEHNISIAAVSSLERAFVLPPHYSSTGQRDVWPASDTSAMTSHDYADYTIRLTGNNRISVERESTTDNVTVGWQVIEAIDHEFKVYRGLYDATNSGTDFFIPINSTVNASNTMVLVTGHHTSTTGTGLYGRFLFNAYAYNSTHIRVARGDGGVSDCQISWVAVEFNLSRISSFQTGRTLVDGGVHTEANHSKVALSPEVNTSTSLLIFQINVSDGGLDQSSVAGYIAGSNQTDFYPSSCGNSGDTTVDRDVRYYIIDFGPQSGQKAGGQLDYSSNANWYNHSQSLGSDFNLSRAVSFVSLTHDGTGIYHPRPFPNIYLDSASSLNIYRSFYGQEAYLEWQVLELPYYKDRYPPNITQIAPSQGYWDDSWDPVNVTFNCSASDLDNKLANISLYITNSLNLSLSYNSSCSPGAQSGYCNWTLELGKGNYSWKCRAYDEYGNGNFSAERPLRLNFTDTTPPVFTQLPVNRTLEIGDAFSYKINATDNYRMSNFTVNDSAFTISTSGLLENQSALSVRLYSLNVTAIDSYGNTNSSVFWLNVTDTTPPQILYMPNVTELSGKPLGAQFQAEDVTGIHSWRVNDTGGFAINSTGFLSNATALGTGIYWINISINDSFKNSVWRRIWVNITNNPDTRKPWFEPVPVDQYSELGTAFAYDIDAYDDYGIGSYNVNDSTFSIDGFGLLSNASALAVGVYYLNVSVNDTSGNINHTLFLVNVSDTTEPAITYITNITVSYNTSLAVQFNASDLSGIYAWSVNDTDFQISSSGLLENATLLALGYHHLLITVNDTYNNSANETIYVRVIDTLAPWFTDIGNITVEYGDGLDYDINASDDVGITSFGVNDSRFAINLSGHLTNETHLPVAPYSLNISVSDGAANTGWAVVWINVTDTTPPLISAYNQTIEYYSDSEGDFDATDLSGIKKWDVNDTRFTIRNGYLTNLLQLAKGYYRLMISVSDIYDNTRYVEVFVNVTPYTGTNGWRVQHGETRMQGSDTYVDIDSVRTDHAFILLTVSAAGSYDDPNRAGIWAEFVNESRFVLHQFHGLADSNYVGWQVIENPNLRSQHVKHSYGSAETAANVSLSKPADPDKSLVVIEYANSPQTSASNFPEAVWTANMTNTTNVRLYRGMGGNGGSVGFFVVEFNDGSLVQKGSIELAGNNTGYFQLGAPVNVSESWVYFSHSSTSDANGLNDMGVIVTNIDSDTYMAYRSGNGGTKRINWYVVTTPGATNRTGQFQGSPLDSGYYPAGGYSGSQINRSLLDVSQRNTGGGTTYSNLLAAYSIINSTHFYMRRESTGNSHFVSYNVIELPTYEISWNQSNLSLGRVLHMKGNASKTVQILASGLQFSSRVGCTGNCSLIMHNFTNGTNLSDGESVLVNFSCKNSTEGNLSALFSVVSNHDSSPDYLVVACNVTRDRAAPVVNINASQNNTVTEDTMPSVGFNFTDRLSTTANCTLYFDGQAVNASSMLSNNTAHSLKSNTTLADQNYTVYVKCTDESNNTGNSKTLAYSVDTLPPDVNNVSPLPGAVVWRNHAVNITANVTDIVSVKRVYANISWQGGSAWQEMLDPDSDSIYVTAFLNTAWVGRYNVTIAANDSLDHINMSGGTWFNVTPVPDIYPPNVSINQSLNNTLTSDATPSVDFNFTDNASQTAVCTLYFNSTPYNTSVAQNSTQTALTANASIPSGTYDVHINCTDLSSNTGMSEHLVYEIDAVVPAVKNITPAASGEFWLFFSVNITANVTDRHMGSVFANISWAAGSALQEMTDADNNSVYETVFLNTNSVGRYNVTVIANDTLGNTNSTEGTWFLVKANSSINYTLFSPLNHSGDNDGHVLFTYRLSSNYNISNCTLFADNVFLAANTSINETAMQGFRVSLAAGRYSWHVNCTDEYGGTNKSGDSVVSVVPTTGFSSMDLSSVNMNSVSGFYLANAYGRINFTGSLNLSGGPDIDRHVSIALNLSSVDTQEAPELNASGIAGLYSLAFQRTPIILRDSLVCADCTVLSYMAGNLTFNVTGWSGYAAAPNSRLIIYDERDSLGGGLEKYVNETVTFFANFSNRTDGSPVAGSCNITVDGTEQVMAFDSGLYTYTTTFAAYDEYQWNVSCTSATHEPLNATDTIVILRQKGVKHGYCTLEYIQTADDHIDGYISEGDKVRIFCEPGYEIGEDEEFSVSVVPGTGISADKILRSPEHIVSETEAIYP